MSLKGATSAEARSIVLSGRRWLDLLIRSEAWSAARLRATVRDLVMQVLFWSALSHDSNICVNLRSAAVGFSWLRVSYR